VKVREGSLVLTETIRTPERTRTRTIWRHALPAQSSGDRSRLATGDLLGSAAAAHHLTAAFQQAVADAKSSAHRPKHSKK